MAQKSIVEQKFDEIVKELFAKILKPKGFKKQGNAFYKIVDGFAPMVEIDHYEFSSGEIDITIKVGLFFPEYQKAIWPNHKIPEFPKLNNRSFLPPPIKELNAQNKLWFRLTSDTEVKVISGKIKTLVEQHVLAYFEQYSTKKDVLQNLFEESSKNPDLSEDYLILFAENGLMKEAQKVYDQLVALEDGPPSTYTNELANKYGLKVKDYALRPTDESGTDNHPLKKPLDKILAAYRDIAQPKWNLCEYKISLEGPELILELNIDGHSGRKARGTLSAWMQLCSRYWTNTYKKEQHESFPHGEFRVEGVYHPVQNIDVFPLAMAEIGRYFWENGQKIEAQQIFWIVLSRQRSTKNTALLAKIPEEFHHYCTLEEKIDEEMWGGRKTMNILPAAKTMAQYAKHDDPIYRCCAIDFFWSSIELAGDARIPTVHNIHEICLQSLFPLTNDPMPMVKFLALACLDDWVNQMMGKYAPKDFVLYGHTLSLIEPLLQYGFSPLQNQLYQWECLVAQDRYSEAEQIWPLIKKIIAAKEINDFKLSVNFFDMGDLTDWRIAALSRVIRAVLSQKKIKSAQLAYVELLINESLQLAEPRIEKSQKVKLERGAVGFLANPYECLAMLRQHQERWADALAAYNRAKELKIAFGLNWEHDNFKEQIMAIKKKLT